VGDHVLGALDVQSREPNAFDQQVIETLQTLANQVSIAIENANLFERTQRAAQTQQRINEFTTNIQRATDISSILSTTVNELSGMLDTAEISIQLAPEDQLKNSENGSASSS
jgi:GAF domain-containing protein